eukprot:361058-Chlamydomonas_euryale.AAC.1
MTAIRAGCVGNKRARSSAHSGRSRPWVTVGLPTTAVSSCVVSTTTYSLRSTHGKANVDVEQLAQATIT